MMKIGAVLFSIWVGSASAFPVPGLGSNSKPEPWEEFDRELATARPGGWSLWRSAAYQKMREPDVFEASPVGVNGIDGSGFPPHTWALTFDDGPCPNTPNVYAVLQAFQLKATFFWLAQRVPSQLPVVRDAEARGFPVENHSFTHRNLAWANEYVLRKEISMANQVLIQNYKTPPQFFRCPFGAGTQNSRVKAALAREHLTHVLWNVDSLDWADHNPARVADRVARQMAHVDHGVILFHDIQAHTPEAVRILLTNIKKSGQPIRFVTIPEIVDEMNPPQP